MNKHLVNPFLNKGLSFSETEREEFGLIGLLPHKVVSIESEIKRLYERLEILETDYQKCLFLNDIYNTNRQLFFKLVEAYVVELMPIIYTPTIAESVTQFSSDFKWPQGALYLDTDHPEEIGIALENATRDMDVLDCMVITDGEGVLGIGDWGINGVMISVGKLGVYTVASGLNPSRVLPVVIDNGTNRSELLNNPYYLGKKTSRKQGEDYLNFIDQFVTIAEEKFPGVLLHWEDFGRDNAQVILDRYRHQVTTFNDDIQGTGIMMIAAFDKAVQVMEKPFSEQRICIFGAGTAGVGIAEQLKNELIFRGQTEEEAREQIFLVDRNGLVVTSDTAVTLGQKEFAKDSEAILDLESIIEAIQPTVLIGCSGQAGKFTQEVVTRMSHYNELPAIFPISNPTHLAEAQAKDIIEWSNGKALVVTGSPTPPFEYGETTFTIGQANNALLYPGLGLGIIAAKAKSVTNSMLLEAAHAISDWHIYEKAGDGLLPHITQLKQCSDRVAQAVYMDAVKNKLSLKTLEEMPIAITNMKW
ncbi:oxaloacetate-decarboxylating malate dehydrogenase [Streptococcus sp. zg-86]|uniref:Oxaloacetate-decarboxylating malate dehydrogenase n=1 Tax=Streptococcus zhangguiae TaxID=2664091 RepID=A0A6I4RJ23_9STRE|nr:MULTISPECIES: NAD-dependent malic enzyme [unclassified Streptococcus]MTB64504.1 oxaloacetate-decarboxylating malate dehydrogenase [Streptococcus sp. zg-86]MTB90806.1 oxaloacetate-decarboxylating malate dehydrogenase [Streptococcus sp. zg-36]MWV56491.1 oxaloacetate-decarboxylating malate dehydrogenase [Streptococcus sp. zg-70]QTH47303.1 NAD-dependent malic enzyme [Streptococcus sp. zg-86]